MMPGEGLFRVSASVRQTLESDFVILWILESGFDALRPQDRGYFTCARVGDGVIALVSTEPVVVCLGTIIEQVHMAGRVPLRFRHLVHRIQSDLDRLQAALDATPPDPTPPACDARPAKDADAARRLTAEYRRLAREWRLAATPRG